MNSDTLQILVGLLCTLLFVGPRPLGAQACLGFDHRNKQTFRASTAFVGTGAEREVTLGLQATRGSSFSGVQAGYGGFSLTKPKAAVVKLQIGTSVFARDSISYSICPIVELSFQGEHGSDGSGRLGGAVRIAIGRELHSTVNYAFVPNLVGAVLIGRQSWSGTEWTPYSRDFFGYAEFGVGVRIGTFLSVRPSVGIPLLYGKDPMGNALFGFDPKYGVAISSSLPR